MANILEIKMHVIEALTVKSTIERAKDYNKVVEQLADDIDELCDEITILREEKKDLHDALRYKGALLKILDTLHEVGVYSEGPTAE